MDVDPSKEKRRRYLFPEGKRETLLNDPLLGEKDTRIAEEVKTRASNLDLRFQYLFEEIGLLRYSRVLDPYTTHQVKTKLDEIEPLLESRLDSERLAHEMDSPDQITVSNFGYSIGHMLSQIYPGDSTEQLRLWWGLALGYFGHPSRALPQSDMNSQGFMGGDRIGQEIPTTSPESILETLAQKFQEGPSSDEFLLGVASDQAQYTIDDFGGVAVSSSEAP